MNCEMILFQTNGFAQIKTRMNLNQILRGDGSYKHLYFLKKKLVQQAWKHHYCEIIDWSKLKLT